MLSYKKAGHQFALAFCLRTPQAVTVRRHVGAGASIFMHIEPSYIVPSCLTRPQGRLSLPRIFKNGMHYRERLSPLVAQCGVASFPEPKDITCSFLSRSQKS